MSMWEVGVCSMNKNRPCARRVCYARDFRRKVVSRSSIPSMMAADGGIESRSLLTGVDTPQALPPPLPRQSSSHHPRHSHRTRKECIRHTKKPGNENTFVSHSPLSYRPSDTPPRQQRQAAARSPASLEATVAPKTGRITVKIDFQYEATPIYDPRIPHPRVSRGTPRPRRTVLCSP